MNSVYKWKFKDGDKEYYAYLVNENGGTGFVYDPELNARKTSVGGTFVQAEEMLSEQAIAQQSSYISSESDYQSKYDAVKAIANSVKANAMEAYNGDKFFNLDYSSCGDVLNGGGLCPIMNFSYKSVPKGQGGVRITNSGTTNGINWYNVEISVEQGTDGEKGEKGDTGATGERGPQGEMGPQGAAGENGVAGSSGKGRSIMAFYTTPKGTESVATPEGGSYNTSTGEIAFPLGWSDSNECESGSCDVWMSTANFYEINESTHIATTDRWSKPVKITGDDGDLGKDGDFIQFIFYHTTEAGENGKPDKPGENESGADFPRVYIGGLATDKFWTDHPNGIGKMPEGGQELFFKIEYMSTRTRDNSESDAEWTEWSNPIVWARWGEDGIDGDGVEYIYATGLTMDSKEELADIIDNINTLVQNSDVWNQPEIYDWLKTNYSVLGYESLSDLIWTDDPRDVGPSEPYEFVSIRRKKWNKNTNVGYFEPFTAPTLWAKWASTPIIVDLSQESVGIGTGPDWQINVNNDSGVTIVTEVYVQSNNTGSGTWFTEIPTATLSASDLSNGVSRRVELKEETEIYSGVSRPTKYEIIINIPDLYTFSTQEHDIKVEIGTKTQAFDGETAQTNLTFTIFAVQGGQEGSVISVVPSKPYIINNLVEGIFSPSAISAQVESNNGAIITPLRMRYYIDSIGPIYFEDTAYTIDLTTESAITENVANIRFEAEITTGRWIHCDIPVIPTGKSVAHLQMSDDSFVIGTDTDNILDVSNPVSATTDLTLWYGNNMCEAAETFVKNITIKYGDTKIGTIVKSGEDTYTANGINGYNVTSPIPPSGYLRKWIIRKQGSETGGVIICIPSGNSIQYLFIVEDKTEFAENYEFEITLGGTYGVVECEATATYKVIGVANGKDGHCYIIKANPREITCNQDKTSFFETSIELSVFESIGETDILLSGGSFTLTGYSENNSPITGDKTVQLSNTSVTINIDDINYNSGKSKSNLHRLHIKYIPTGSTLLYDTIDIYVSPRAGNAITADFDNDTWMVGTGKGDHTLDIATSASTILNVLYGTVSVPRSAVTITYNSPAGVTTTTSSTNYTVTFNISNGTSLSTPKEVSFTITGTTPNDKLTFSTTAKFKIYGVADGNDGEYFELKTNTPVIYKDATKYIEGWRQITLSVKHSVGGTTSYEGFSTSNYIKYTIKKETGNDTTGTTSSATFSAYTSFLNATQIIFEYYRGGSNYNGGTKWDDETVEVETIANTNPNILNRTLFNSERGLDFIFNGGVDNPGGHKLFIWYKEYNTGGTPSGVDYFFNINADTTTFIDGQEGITFGWSGSSLTDTHLFANYVGIHQVVGSLKPDTWYTLSFNAKTHNSGLAIYFTKVYGKDAGPDTEASNRYVMDFSYDGYFYVDNEKVDNLYWDSTAQEYVWNLYNDGCYEWNFKRNGTSWDYKDGMTDFEIGTRHSISFKTRSDLGTDQCAIVFRGVYPGSVTIINPKLEEGIGATPYVPNANDYGKKGDDAEAVVYYWLELSTTSINIDFVGNKTPSSLTIKVHRTEGETDTIETGGALWYQTNAGTPGRLNSYRDAQGTYTFPMSWIYDSTKTIRLWWKKVNSTDSSNSNTQIETVSIIHESLGKMLYSAGIWESKTYSADTTSAPFVYYDSNDNSKKGYYYLKTDSANTDPTTDTTNWAKMTQFSAVLTDMLIAKHARLGKAVYYLEFMFSQYGRNHTGGTVDSEDGFKDFLIHYNTGALLPESARTVNDILDCSKFIPNYFVNLKTGETYGKLNYGASRDIITEKTGSTVMLNDYEDVYFLDYSGSSTPDSPAVFNLKNSESNAGRRITLINVQSGLTYAGETEPGSRNEVWKITFENNDKGRILENGVLFEYVLISNETIELVYLKNKVWLVTSRNDVLTNSKYGANFKYLAHLYIKITGSGSSRTIGFDNSGDARGLSNSTFDGSVIYDGTPDEGHPYYDCVHLSDVSNIGSSTDIKFRIYMPQKWCKNGTNQNILSCITIPHSDDDIWVNLIDNNSGNFIEIGADSGVIGNVMEFIVFNAGNLYSQNYSKSLPLYKVRGGGVFNNDSVRISPISGTFTIPPEGGYFITECLGYSSTSVLKQMVSAGAVISSWTTVGTTSDGYTKFKAVMAANTSPYSTSGYVINYVTRGTTIGGSDMSKVYSYKYLLEGNINAAYLRFGNQSSTPISGGSNVPSADQQAWSTGNSDGEYGVPYASWWVEPGWKGRVQVSISEKNFNSTDELSFSWASDASDSNAQFVCNTNSIGINNSNGWTRSVVALVKFSGKLIAVLRGNVRNV